MTVDGEWIKEERKRRNEGGVDGQIDNKAD